MLLAEALKRIHMGRNWTWTRETKDENYLKIVKRFIDDPQAAFSIHQISKMGQESGKKISDWFSPNEISQVLKYVHEHHLSSDSLCNQKLSHFRKLVRLDEKFSNLTVHVALDHQLATEEIFDLQDTSSFKPLLIIIPLRLGLGEINPIYIDGLRKCLELDASMGIIGGRPNQALYFFGCVGDDQILYLDPHTCQRSGGVGNKDTPGEIEMDETFHQRFAGRMAFTSMDPSIAVSFFCKTRQDFDQLIQQLVTKDGKTPIFEVIKSRSIPWTSASSSMASSRDLENDLNVICGDQATHDEFEELKEGSDDEFEIID